MSTPITPVTTTVHATHTAPAPLDPANGTEIANAIQTVADNAAIALLRCGSHRIVAQGGIRVVPAAGVGIDTYATTSSTSWATAGALSLTLAGLLEDDIIFAELVAHVSMSSGNTGAIRIGGDVPSALSDIWCHVPADAAEQNVGLVARAAVTADGDAGLTVGAIVTGGTLTIHSPIALRAYALRENA